MGTENSENIFHIDWEPIGIRSECESGRTILEAARLAGISLTAACGGNGMCRACKVILRNGSLSSLTTIETNGLSESEIQSGVRLACQAKLCGNIRLDIPPSSLEGAQRLQL